jgi:hypothetical protein
MADDAFQAALSATMRGWNAKPVIRGPEPVSGAFEVPLGQLGITGEDEAVDFYRFCRDTAHRAAGTGGWSRTGPVVDFLQAITGCLKAGGPVTVKPVSMTWNEMQTTAKVLRAAADHAALAWEGQRHVRVAAARLAEAWEAFSGTKADSRDPRERRLAWGDERGWIDF